MNAKTSRRFLTIPGLLMGGLMLTAGPAHAAITGVAGPTFNLQAKVDRLATADGGSYLLWGYSNGSARAQYPGPTLIVNQGDVVTVNLQNRFPLSGTSAGRSATQPTGQNVSIVFPGQEVSASCVSAAGTCDDGVLTLEARRLGIVRYTFTASRPGTFLFHSGTRPELQVEMGMIGALIVRPTGFSDSVPANRRAYAEAASQYDREYLFLLSEIDPRIHDKVEFQGVAALDTTTDYLSDYFSNYWFLNGRNAPDTMGSASATLFPTQPYNCLPRMHPGEKVLMRVIGAGHELHPFHHHGNHARIIAKDGRPLKTPSATGFDLSYEVFTIQSVPGETVDAIFEWTGKGLGWDIYNHAPGDALQPNEYAADHGKPFPVVMPEQQSFDFGAMYGGSPFLGVSGILPPGAGGFNPSAGYMYMWHSHTEKEITNFDIFPGGMMTMLIVEHPSQLIP